MVRYLIVSLIKLIHLINKYFYVCLMYIQVLIYNEIRILSLYNKNKIYGIPFF